MIHELGPTPGRFDMAEEEAADLVDRVAKRLWGRTAFEEIAADIDAMEAKIDLDEAPLLSAEGLYDAYMDFVRLRRQFLAAAKSAGPSSILPRAFPLMWCDRLLPWHIVATPGGSVEEEDAPSVIGTTLKVPMRLEKVVPRSVSWARRYAAPQGSLKFAPQDDAAWYQMLERQVPRALLMLNGRRHRLMVPPALERIIQELDDDGVPVRFHPRFEWPAQRDPESCTAEAVALAAFSARRTFICDITGDEILPSDAAVITAWEFRRSPLLDRFRAIGFTAEIKLVTDWSDWIVRRDLLN